MPSLIGNKPNQVPSNGDLGTMAFRAQEQFYGTDQNVSIRNRLINGAMTIDQRNAGAEVNPAVSATYYLDRWQAISSAASKFKIGQNAGSVTPPAEFINYLGITSLSAYTAGAAEGFAVQQRIEGFNIADLNWGTANAKTVTISFWVRSSLTGTFGGAIRNSASDRSYPYSYTISSANTWEQKSVTIAGDTTGTWLTTNGTGINLSFGLGAGSTLSNTAGAWAAGSFISATGATSVVGTNGATFYITGVQLEKGTQATSFEYRQYGQELALCQRYYENNSPVGVAPSNLTVYLSRLLVTAYSTGAVAANISFVTPKRASPTITIYGGSISGTSNASVYISGAWNTMTTSGVGSVISNGYELELAKSASFTAGTSYISQCGWAASAEL